ncbi:MAG: ABC transporter ATP-binding protein [Lawsonibacter sp.]|nr:ABC transporter ATP-binding protein [Lawsonibacter sp.]
MTMEHLLDVQDLSIHFLLRSGTVKAVNGVSFSLEAGETLGLVGETGAGKTTTALGIMGLVQSPPGKVLDGKILFQGKNLRTMDNKEMRTIRGSQISMIFQDPMTSLNPIDTVGEQIAEVIRLHSNGSSDEVRKKAEEMLELVGIDKDRYGDYPHQFSGGMKQRVVIAIALACNPKLLIADEPTTALDVTIQAQVLDLINDLKKKFNTSVILITHDLGVVAEVCDKVAIMYSGEIVESGTLKQVFDHPLHPYTQGLFSSIPSLTRKVRRLTPIKGMMPDPICLPAGCKFAERCPKVSPVCTKTPFVYEVEPAHFVRCALYKTDAEEKTK